MELSEKEIAFANLIAELLVKELKKRKDDIKENNSKKADDSFEFISKQFSPMAPSLYGRNVKMLNEDFIRTFSSGKLCDFTACKSFLERKFLTNNFSDCAKKSTAYFTYIELAQPVVNPFFISGKENLLSILLDIRPSDLKDVIHYQKYVAINSHEKFVENNAFLPMSAILDIKRYGHKIEIATGGQALQHLLSTFDMKSVLDDLKKKYICSGKKLSLKNQKRISLIKYFIDNDIDVNDIMISVLPVPQIDIFLKHTPDNVRNNLKTLYSIIAMKNDRSKYLCELNSPTIIVENSRRMLQESVEKLFKKSFKVYGCEDVATNCDIDEIKNICDEKYSLNHEKIKAIFGVPKDYDVSVWENFVAMLLGVDISSNEDEKFTFNSFLLDNNAFEDQSVWDNYLYNL